MRTSTARLKHFLQKPLAYGVLKPDKYEGVDGIPLVRIMDVAHGVVHEACLDKISPAQSEEFRRTVLDTGDLVCSVVGTIGATFITPASLAGANLSRALARIQLGPRANTRYVQYVLQSPEFHAFVALNTDSTAQNVLNLGTLADVRVPTSDVQQQERIANFLDEQTARIDALIAEKEDLLRKLSEYAYSRASSVMTLGLDSGVKLQKPSFPELGCIPAHWEVKRLKFLGDVRSGVAKGKDIGDKTTVSLPYLRVANVQDGYVDLTDVQYIEVSETDAQRYLLRKGDVLMNEGGDNDKLGRGTVWEGQIDPCIHQNHVFALRLHDLHLAEWVARFTSTDAARSYFFLRSKQSTNLASINQSNVRELPVPMPPAEERQAILKELRSVIARVQELTLHVEMHIERLHEYRSSLISAAVTGQHQFEADAAWKEAA